MNYLTPEWEEAGEVHDWRNHVTQQVRDIWHTFTDEQKEILYKHFEYNASCEEWD